MDVREMRICDGCGFARVESDGDSVGETGGMLGVLPKTISKRSQ